MSPERIRPGSARARQGGENAAPEHSEAGQGAETEAPPGAAVGEGSEAAAEAPAPEERAGASGDSAPQDVPVGESAPVDDAGEEPTPFTWRVAPPIEPSGEEELLPEPEPILAPGRQAAANGRASATASVEIDDEPVGIVVPEPASGEHLNWFRKLYFGRTHFDFVRHRRIWFAISSVLILAGAISLGVRGLNLSIDFVGGTSWTVPAKTLNVSSSKAVNEARNAVAPFGLAGATITELGVGSNATIEVAAKVSGTNTAVNSSTLRSEVATALGKLAHTGPESVSITQVGPSWGSQITNKAIEALIVFFILIAIYISIFFEWRMALAAIVAVAHDVMVVVGIYSLTGLEVTPDTVVAVLTILGYSLYDTIVVFDRVRDNIRSLGPSNKLTISDIVNLSMNQTLARSVNTSLVAILPILAVLLLGAEVLGATTLEYFGFALLIGLLSGAYSSIFIASPLVALMKEKEQRWRNVRERLARRGADRLLLSPADIAAGILDGDGGLRRSPAAERRAQSRVLASGGAIANESVGGREPEGVALRSGPSRAAARKRPGGSRPAARRRGGRR